MIGYYGAQGNFVAAAAIPPPTCIVYTSVDVVSDPFVVYIQFSLPVFGFVVGDITALNSGGSVVLSGFTAISTSLYSVLVTPTGNGTISVSVAQDVCADIDGNLNLASNVLQTSYVVYDIENATKEVDLHLRGCTHSLSDNSDLVTSVNFAAGELIMAKYGWKNTQQANGTSAVLRAAYEFGVLDFGVLAQNTTPGKAWDDLDPLVTDIRGGHSPCVGGYKNGVDTYKNDLLEDAFCVRNSKTETVNQTLPIEYTGLTHAQLISRGITFRSEYYSESSNGAFYFGDVAQGNAKLELHVPAFLEENGWFIHFSHWGFFIKDYIIHWIEKIESLIGSNDVYRGTMNEIVEYYVVREAVDSIAANGRTITVNYTKKFTDGAPYSKIFRTPVWIRLDLTGTAYEGHDIAITGGGKIRSMGNDVYHVSVMLDFNVNSVSFDVIKTTSPDYMNLNVPVVVRTGNSVTSDQPVKVALFSRPKTDTYIVGQNLRLDERKSVFDTSFELTTILNEASRDYYLAYINEDGVSGVTSETWPIDLY